MPQKNKTGPEGKGPRTGRGMGHCREPTIENQYLKQKKEGEYGKTKA